MPNMSILIRELQLEKLVYPYLQIRTCLKTVEDDWLSLNMDTERAILQRHAAYGRRITLSYAGKDIENVHKASWRSLDVTRRPHFSSHATDGNYPHIQVKRRDTGGRHFGDDSVHLSEGIETTVPCGIWRKARSLSVSDCDTLLLSRIRSYKYHDRG